ncbi:hypothetical protein [Bradyrhizobium sp. HKCCYLS20291]|uniref:hypothetical protein n=1 Tax=Bradyrhizobium sp. HKCCYLS20291 TaxID=3420766 RepID=UPI003EBBA514
MFSKLKDIATGAAKSVSGQFARASSAIADLAASLATRAAAAADLGRILDIIEMVPGVTFDRPDVNADFLETLLAAVQMGELTIAVHYRKETEASVVRLHPAAPTAPCEPLKLLLARNVCYQHPPARCAPSPRSSRGEGWGGRRHGKC